VHVDEELTMAWDSMALACAPNMFTRQTGLFLETTVSKNKDCLGKLVFGGLVESVCS
jgi:hypothetical protein